LASSIKVEGNDSVAAGRQILKSSLEQPFRILLENAGINADEWLPQVRKGKAGQGLDVNKPAKLVDLKVVGIVDPARVTKEAVQNAASIAGTAMTMGALVVDVPEKTPPMPSPDMGGGMMGMYSWPYIRAVTRQVNYQNLKLNTVTQIAAAVLFL
jgi:chaperonin GroEL